MHESHEVLIDLAKEEECLAHSAEFTVVAGGSDAFCNFFFLTFFSNLFRIEFHVVKKTQQHLAVRNGKSSPYGDIIFEKN